MSATTSPRVSLRYDVTASHEDWTLSEDPVPESQPHDIVLDELKDLLLYWVRRLRKDAQVARNLAARWDESRPQIGVDPDVCVIEPATPEGDELESLCLWKEGHHPPVLAIEVVSKSNATKDYTVAPEKYAASGTRELWIFDARLRGPKSHGGPHRLQIWRREGDDFTRVHAGEGPARSEAVNAWLFVVDEGRRLRIADDPAGTSWWHTSEEAALAAKDEALAAKDEALAAKDEALAAKDEALAAKDEALAAKDEALARVAELEAVLRAHEGG